MKNDYDDGELHKDFGETESTFNEVRWCVFLGTQLISYSFTLVRRNFCMIFEDKCLQKFIRLVVSKYKFVYCLCELWEKRH